MNTTTRVLMAAVLASRFIAASCFVSLAKKTFVDSPAQKPWGFFELASANLNSRQQRMDMNKHNIFDKMFEEEGPLGKGVTVGKLQVSLMSDDRSPDSIFGLLERASRSSDDSPEGLAEMCHEICMALLRKQQDWIAACSDSRWFKADDAGKAESQFNEWANTEAAKFEKEYLVPSEKEGGPTVAVVSLIIEIEGDNTVFEKAGFSRAETQKVLTSIASDVLVDEGQVMNAFEVFWTPGDGKEVLTNRDLIVDFPELITL